MSYDTTVHDTLDPPAPRGVAARVAGSGGHGRGLRTRRFWKPAVIAAAALSVLLLVTWLVAALSPRPVNQPADESRPASHSSLMPGGNAKLPLSVIENQFGVCEPSRGAK